MFTKKEKYSIRKFTV
ncbi:TPA: YSIRK-type signal peptide-containing protein [Staphylococcus aureus]|nr:YSIRK-type signal peptide-containing protein [Staphylococcus aureus]